MRRSSSLGRTPFAPGCELIPLLRGFDRTTGALGPCGFIGTRQPSAPPVPTAPVLPSFTAGRTLDAPGTSKGSAPGRGAAWCAERNSSGSGSC